ncbi:MAG: hypothetical protein U1E05_27620, partial [Patescibacteria group bacterium]|nr:hypothetical protein [Patescibacteria group bacterium]
MTDALRQARLADGAAWDAAARVGGTRWPYATVWLAMFLAATGCGQWGPLAGDSATDPATAGADSARPAGDGGEQVRIVYPWPGALFPPEIAAPTFRWSANAVAAVAWKVEVRFQDGWSLDASTTEQEWTPPDESWEQIKSRSRDADAV